MGDKTGTGYGGGIKKGLTIDRYFSHVDGDVYDKFDWTKSDAKITDDNGKLLFIQKDTEFPKDWGQLSRDVVASRYFYGEHGTPQRENSVKQLVGRVSKTMGEWASKQNYFNSENDTDNFIDELSYIALNQMMAFNSPVWFNVGVDKYTKDLEGKLSDREAYIIGENKEVIRMPIVNDYKYPQTSACFIQSVDDTMESIMDLATREALLFKHGSGTGTNLSTLRSSRERLSGGGKPSGPLAYLMFYDRVAGIVKSGGKTRRAAKMNILNDSHPDIEDFVTAKAIEQEKIHALISLGYDFKTAQDTVAYQNANLSVRLSDDFMKDVEEDREWQTKPVYSRKLYDQMPKFRARDLFRKIAENAHACGDPGVQFNDSINRMHTCPNSGIINSSNPCSEYMFLDDSSCNLASLNLMKFMNNGVFDVEKFGNAVRTTAIAQDLEIDNSSFPTAKIAENSHKFRPLGTGYSNLGSLVMYCGLPYDSDEARTTGAALMALLTGKVYETSTEMAEKIGTFEEFEKNKNSMLFVVKKHRASLKDIDRNKLPKGLEGVLDEAEMVWDRVIERGNKYGFRNAQATVLAPTGTISFMMGCDTTGIEPELGLVKTKRLAEGGTMKIVNNMVEPALENLGYDNEKIKSILNYMLEYETIEGSGLKEEHLPIFDTSFKSSNGNRFISPHGHLKMMAAVQPFVSGAISKTVNLPKETSVDEIEQIYMDAWKMGLKSVALYRDGCKEGQPLSSGSGDLEKKLKEKGQNIPTRRKLPTTRNSLTHKFDIVGHEGYVTVGMYDDGKPGELFINMSKEGSTVGGLMDTVGTLSSLALQYGVPLETLVKKFRHQRFEPAGLVMEGHPEIHTATSITDYIFNFMGEMFLEKNGKDEISELQNEKNKKDHSDNPGNKKMPDAIAGGFCLICGNQMRKRGSCDQICDVCNYSDTKSCGG